MEWKKVLAFVLALAMLGSSAPAFALEEMKIPENQIEQQGDTDTEHAPEQGELSDTEQTQSETQKPEQTDDEVPMQPLTPAAVPVEEKAYKFYPKPQEITYQEGGVTLEDTVDVVFESGVDAYTEQRAEDALDEVHVRMRQAESVQAADLLVGIYDNADTAVDDWFKQQMGGQSEKDFDVFEKTDSYMLVVKNGKIGVLGKDTDAAFYGLTTLRQILQQTDNDKLIQAMEITDWADVASRGFIEGYYGEPWSTEDRVELMRWGGNLKLNSYFYAPKDDPKHNKQWREKYTEQELREKIEPLAKAGNASKCQFVFALHPFMNSPITDENYEESLQTLKEKFEQVMGVGVRQIAVLADDAANQGNDLYIRLMKDLVDWVSSEEMQEKYSGLKKIIPFCPVQYMGNGEAWMQEMPDEVPIVMTGGKVWGEVADSFTDTFYGNVDRGPYMWINWPCTDNSKRHLIMGGYTTFLHPEVNPEKIQGIVLNPMQQSEPSKVAIFGNACYAWNIWTEREAEQAWEDSFSYVDHDTHEETEASEALRELSKHMINQNMDNRVTKLEESVELKPKLDAFKEKMTAGSLTQEDIDKLRREFALLEDAAETYRREGNPRIAEQIVYWLDTWKNITSAANHLLNALQAYYLEDDANMVPTYFVEAQAQLEEAETHGFPYVDHTEYAEVGVQHIMPFMRAMRDHVAMLSKLTVDPTALIATAITNRTDNPTGALSNLVDGDISTEVIFKEGSAIHTGDYIGVMYNRAIPITDVKFVTGRQENAEDTFERARLMYTEDGEEWKPVPDVPEFTDGRAVVEAHGLTIKAKGIRLEATADRTGKWFAAREIYVNEIPEESEGITSAPLKSSVIKSAHYSLAQNTNENTLSDTNDDTFVWYKMAGDSAKQGDFVGMELDQTAAVGRVHAVVGKTGSKDKFKRYHVEYSKNGTSDWQRVPKEKIRVNDGVIVNDDGSITGLESGKDILDIELGGMTVKAVRIVNDEPRPFWVQFGGFLLYPSNVEEIIHTPEWKIQQNAGLDALIDGNDSTSVWFDPDGDVNVNQDHSRKGEYIGVKLREKQKIGKVRFVVGNDTQDKWKQYHLEYSPSADGDADWVSVRPFAGAQSGKDIVEVNLGGVTAQRVRIVNDEDTPTWVKFSEITVDGFDVTKDAHVFTNNDAARQNVYGTIDNEEVSISKAFEITLKPNEYFGFELPRIRQLSEITVDAIGQEGLTLKAGANLEEMNAYTEGSVNARYVYLQNDTDQPISFYLDALKAKITEPKAIHFDSIEGLPVASKGDDAVEQGRTGSLFDGNVNTDVTFARKQKNGGTITYDLGQTREIRKIEALMKDAQRDFIRSGVIEVAQEKDGEWTTVVTIDEMGEDGNTPNEDTAGSVGWGESSSNYPNFKSYTGTLDTPAAARYLRIRLTADYDHRWINLSEILINDGEYIPVHANPTFVVEPAEVSGDFIPDFVADGNVSTGFKPDMTGKNQGSLTYKLSASTHIDQINILQSSANISNAHVSVRGIPSAGADARTAAAAEKGEWVEIGMLTEPLTSIYTYNFDSIYEIKLEWGAVQPIIYEIAVVANEALEVDATALARLLEKCGELTEEEKQKYQMSAVTAYEAARKEALEMVAAVAQGKIDAQAKVNEVYAKLLAANKTLLGSTEDLITAKQNLRDLLDSYSKYKYTPNSWEQFINDSAYRNAVFINKKDGINLKEITDATIALMEAAERILVEESSGGTHHETSRPEEEKHEDTKAPLIDKPVLPVNQTVAVAANNGDVVSIKTQKIGDGYVLSVSKDGKEVTDLEGGITVSLPTSETGMGAVAVIGSGDAQTVSKKSYIQDGNMIVTIAGSCTVQIEDRAVSFADVTDANWFKNPVDFVTARSLFMGAAQNTFAPAQSMNRGMLAMVLYRLEGEPAVASASAFQDIAPNQYYANAVAWAAKKGIVHGISADKFSPNVSITREQLASILYRYAGSPSASQTLDGFADADKISDYSIDAMQWAVQKKILSGRGDHTLDPKGTATRAEVAQMLMQFVKEI
ncbi:MAG: beta-N-acetylglucosaminidase domain-containing protein [Butyricicoccus pullicaecorum]|nr:beta-N-acetylglucosaminidase domain-containing protein [Butyricicoccus pullicaecorum]